MYCMKCGERLPEDASFCFKCGNQLQKKIDSENGDNRIDEKEKYKSFMILQQQIQFPEVMGPYASIRNYFHGKVCAALNRYDKRFKCESSSIEDFLECNDVSFRYTNLKDFVNYADEDFKKELFRICQEAVKLLNRQGIYEITDKIFYHEVNRQISGWNTYFEYIKKQEKYIQEEGSSQKEYREFRKDSRGRVIGGGIGIEGFAKGAIMAGGVNMATGVAHSIFNGIGNYGTDLETIRKERQLFENDSFFSAIRENYYFDLLKVHEVFMDYLCEYKNKERVPYYGKKAYEKSCNVLININQNNIEGEMIKVALVEALKIYPFNDQVYEYIIRNFSNPGNLDELVTFLSIDLNKIREVLNKEKSKIDSEKNIEKVKEEIINDIVAKNKAEREEKQKRKEMMIASNYTISDSKEKEKIIGENFEYLKRLHIENRWYCRFHIIEKQKQIEELIQRVRRSYKYQLENEEQEIFVLDNTLFSRNSSVGIVLTNKNIYIKESKLCSTNKIKLQDIVTLEESEGKILINDINFYLNIDFDWEEGSQKCVDLIVEVLQHCTDELRKLDYRA